MLHALKKKRHYKTKVSLSNLMLRSYNGKYWKSARVLRKNNYNCTTQETIEALGGTDIMPKHADACRSRYVCIFK